MRKQFSVNAHSTRKVVLLSLLFLAAAAPLALAQTFTVLHSFTNVPDGGNPNPIVRDAQENLYGTTIWGGVVCGPFGAPPAERCSR
jgi:hypothetical protein